MYLSTMISLSELYSDAEKAQSEANIALVRAKVAWDKARKAAEASEKSRALKEADIEL